MLILLSGFDALMNVLEYAVIHGDVEGVSMSIVLLSLGAGCIWHGLQIVWVAPTPSQLRRERSVDSKPRDAAQAFQIFWLDQYAWMGISLTALGCLFVLLEVI